MCLICLICLICLFIIVIIIFSLTPTTKIIIMKKSVNINPLNNENPRPPKRRKAIFDNESLVRVVDEDRQKTISKSVVIDNCAAYLDAKNPTCFVLKHPKYLTVRHPFRRVKVSLKSDGSVLHRMIGRDTSTHCVLFYIKAIYNLDEELPQVCTEKLLWQTVLDVSKPLNIQKKLKLHWLRKHLKEDLYQHRRKSLCKIEFGLTPTEVQSYVQKLNHEEARYVYDADSVEEFHLCDEDYSNSDSDNDNDQEKKEEEEEGSLSMTLPFQRLFFPDIRIDVTGFYYAEKVIGQPEERNAVNFAMITY